MTWMPRRYKKPPLADHKGPTIQCPYCLNTPGAVIKNTMPVEQYLAHCFAAHIGRGNPESDRRLANMAIERWNQQHPDDRRPFLK